MHNIQQKKNFASQSRKHKKWRETRRQDENTTVDYKDYLPGGLNSMVTGASFLGGDDSVLGSFLGGALAERALSRVVGVSWPR